MSDALLRVVDVRKRFEGEGHAVEVLRGVSFEVGPCEALAIMGPSGSGKSTLLHLIGGLDAPTSGTITFDGTAPHALPEPELARFRNRTIGFVFQDPHLLPQYTVLENVIVPALAFRDGGVGAAERARALVDRVGLSPRLGHRPAALSGGERQRVAVARALINRPRLLLCDEPTGSLDSAAAEGVARLLVELSGSGGVTLIVVTHDAELARRFPRLLRLRDGRAC